MSTEQSKCLNDLRDLYHNRSTDAGWWDELQEVKLYLPDNLKPVVERWHKATKLCLMHSEISEMMESIRKDSKDTHLPNRRGVEVEGADLLIRYLDFAGYDNHDVDAVLLEKGEYNKIRADHKIGTNRKKKF